MISERDDPSQRLKHSPFLDISNIDGSFYNILSFYSQLPKNAKPLALFSEEETIKVSSHTIKIVKKIGKPTRHFLKEAPYYICQAEEFWAKVFAALLYNKKNKLVPSTSSVFDDSRKIIAVASKELLGFKSNRKNPLCREDLRFELIDEKRIVNKNHLIKQLTSLNQNLNRNTLQQSYLSYFPQIIKNNYNYYISSDPTAVKLHEITNHFIKNNAFDFYSLKELNDKLVMRMDHLNSLLENKNNKNSQHHKGEYVLLQECLQCINLLFLTDIPVLEEIDDRLYTKGIILEELPENQLLEEIINEKNYQITVKHFKNFRLIRNLIRALIARRVFEDQDNHNENFSKYGQLIDFGLSGYKVTKQLDELEKNKWLLNLFRIFEKPDDTEGTEEETIQRIIKDIRNFPVLSTPFRYWPTNETGLNLTNNSFREEDRAVYTLLKDHPVTQFYKFKELLKYLLLPDKLYTEIANFTLSKEFEYLEKNTNNRKTLYHELIQTSQNKTLFKKALFRMSEWHDFIQQYGDWVYFSLVKKEFIDYMEKISLKISKKPYYESFFKIIDLDDISQEFENLKIETDNHKKIDQFNKRN